MFSSGEVNGPNGSGNGSAADTVLIVQPVDVSEPLAEPTSVPELEFDVES
jgi:hypothetical protein